MQYGKYIFGRRLNLPPERAEAYYLLRWVRTAQSQLAHVLCAPSLMTAEAAWRLLNDLLEQLTEISESVFETIKCELMARENPFLEFDHRLATTLQRRTASDWLLCELEQTNADVVFKRAPLLQDLLDQTTERFIAAVNEFFDRFEKDRLEICRMFYGGMDCGLITHICSDGADSHFHGRRTCVVKTQRGAFVYKPRDCRIDDMFHSTMQLGFADYLKIPRCIACSGYGYCEFMQPSPIAFQAEVALYFERLGEACALLNALGSTDMHSENWICCDGYPALVDLETILTPLPYDFGNMHIWPDMDLQDDFCRDINRSLSSSGMLPARLGDKELSVLLDKSATAYGLPVLNGIKYTVIGFESNFKNGFSDGYDRCMRLKRVLHAMLDCFREPPLRRLIRNSDGYAKLRSQLYTLPALRSYQSRSNFANKLGDFFRIRDAEQLLPIADWEAKCLLEGDIPYFSSSGDGHALMGYGNVIHENFFRLSAIENAQQRIAALCEGDKRFEMDLLSQSIARAIVPTTTQFTSPAAANSELITPNAALAEAEDIFRQIESLLITAPSGRSSWLVLSERSMRLTPAKPVFSNGTAGIGVFCAALAAASADRDIVRRAEDLTTICLDQLMHYTALLEHARALPERVLPLGITDGIAGALRALTLIEQYTKRKLPRLLAERLIKLLDNVDIANAQQMDVYSGTAGLLLALCQRFEHCATDDVLKHIRRTAAKLLSQRHLQTNDGLMLWDTLGRSRPISGAGHGMAGIAVALMSAAHILGNPKCAEAASAALEFEHSVYSSKLKTWPDLRASSAPLSAMHGLCSGGARSWSSAASVPEVQVLHDL